MNLDVPSLDILSKRNTPWVKKSWTRRWDLNMKFILYKILWDHSSILICYFFLPLDQILLILLSHCSLDQSRINHFVHFFKLFLIISVSILVFPLKLKVFSLVHLFLLHYIYINQKYWRLVEQLTFLDMQFQKNWIKNSLKPYMVLSSSSSIYYMFLDKTFTFFICVMTRSST